MPHSTNDAERENAYMVCNWLEKSAEKTSHHLWNGRRVLTVEQKQHIPPVLQSCWLCADRKRISPVETGTTNFEGLFSDASLNVE